MRNTTATGVPGRPRTPLWGRRRRKASSTWSINASSSSTSSMRRRAGSQSFSPSGRIISKMLRCACWRRTIAPPRTASRLVQLRHRQRNLGEVFFAREAESLMEAWMKEVDEILEDEPLLDLVYEQLGRRYPQSRK